MYESLNEMNFQRKMDNPLSVLGIGQKQLIKDWLDEMKIDDYKIGDDYTISILGSRNDIHLEDQSLIKFPDFIQFGRVNGLFYCHINGLTSLRGCPTYVDNHFACNNNELASLDGCPRHVGFNFRCNDNLLENLEGCPEYVGWDFHCGDNKIKFTKKYIRSLCDVKGEIYA